MKVVIGKDAEPRRHLTVRLLWEPRDIWVGVFWNTVSGERLLSDFLLIYICVLPCLPVAIAWKRKESV